MLERVGYFEVPGAHLYTVLHQVEEPVARLLLIGPFASERHFSYHPWVRWARYLAGKQIEVLRYDYRGVGESTGAFEELTFDDWIEDVRLLSQWFANRLPKVPMILHGLEVGALLAANTFHQHGGDALLLWSPPANANLALRASLLRWAGLEQIFESIGNRKSVTDFVAQLEAGSPIEIQGYKWSSRIWHDSFNVALPDGLANENLALDTQSKPVKIVKLDKEAAPLVRPYVGYDEVRDLSWLYDDSFSWIAHALTVGGVHG